MEILVVILLVISIVNFVQLGHLHQHMVYLEDELEVKPFSQSHNHREENE